jgi:hypothetical protein
MWLGLRHDKLGTGFTPSECRTIKRFVGPLRCLEVCIPGWFPAVSSSINRLTQRSWVYSAYKTFLFSPGQRSHDIYWIRDMVDPGAGPDIVKINVYWYRPARAYTGSSPIPYFREIRSTLSSCHTDTRQLMQCGPMLCKEAFLEPSLKWRRDFSYFWNTRFLSILGRGGDTHYFKLWA